MRAARQDRQPRKDRAAGRDTGSVQRDVKRRELPPFSGPCFPVASWQDNPAGVSHQHPEQGGRSEGHTEVEVDRVTRPDVSLLSHYCSATNPARLRHNECSPV